MMGMKRGFTIIEVMLFLGISGLLFLIAFSYTNSTIENTRFTDGSNQLTEFVRGQLTSVKNSNITRPTGVESICGTTTAAGQSNCTILGKVLYFDADNKTIRSLVVVGTAEVTSAASDRDAIAAAAPKVLSDGAGATIPDETFTLPWGMTITTLTRMPVSGVPSFYNAIYMLRSPISERVLIGTTNIVNGNQSLNYNNYSSGIPFATANTNMLVDRPALICARMPSNPNRLAVTFGVGTAGSSTIKKESVQAATVVQGMTCP